MLKKLIIISPLIYFTPYTMASNVSATLKPERIEVQGHRGARSVRPENTLAAFEYALNIGVDTLELDLGVTKDDVPVVYHDQKINRKLCSYKDGSKINDELWVRELTLEQIKQFDCGSLPNRKFPNQVLVPGSEIPTLEQLFKLVDQSQADTAKSVEFNIETKSKAEFPQAQPSPEQFTRLVIDVIEKYELMDRVTLQSFDHRTLQVAKILAPTIQLAALYGDKPDDWVVATQNAEANIVSPNFKDIDADDVAAIRQAGLKVIPWTVNRAEDWQTMIDLGVDGIITDDPAALLKYLGRE